MIPIVKWTRIHLFYIPSFYVLIYILSGSALGSKAWAATSETVADPVNWSTFLIASAGFLVAAIAVVFALSSFVFREGIKARFRELKKLQKEMRNLAQSIMTDLEKTRAQAVEKIERMLKDTSRALQESLNRQHGLRSAIFQSSEVYESILGKIKTERLDERTREILLSLIKGFVESSRLERETSLLFLATDPPEAVQLIHRISSSPYRSTALNVLRQYHKSGYLREEDTIHETLHEALHSVERDEGE